MLSATGVRDHVAEAIHGAEHVVEIFCGALARITFGVKDCHRLFDGKNMVEELGDRLTQLQWFRSSWSSFSHLQNVGMEAVLFKLLHPQLATAWSLSLLLLAGLLGLCAPRCGGWVTLQASQRIGLQKVLKALCRPRLRTLRVHDVSPEGQHRSRTSVAQFALDLWRTHAPLLHAQQPPLEVAKLVFRGLRRCTLYDRTAHQRFLLGDALLNVEQPAIGQCWTVRSRHECLLDPSP